MGQILCVRYCFPAVESIRKTFHCFCRFSVLFNRSALHFTKIENCTLVFPPPPPSPSATIFSFQVNGNFAYSFRWKCVFFYSFTCSHRFFSLKFECSAKYKHHTSKVNTLWQFNCRAWSTEQSHSTSFSSKMCP